MFSKWSNMPPIAKWGSFAAAMMLGFVAIRALLSRGGTTSTETEYADVATGGAVGD